MELVWNFDGEQIPFTPKVIDDQHIHFYAPSRRAGGCGISLFNTPLCGQFVYANILMDGTTKQKEFKGTGFDCVLQAVKWINAETARFSQVVSA